MSNLSVSQGEGLQESNKCTLFSRLLSAVIILLLTGCVRLPDYALPQLIENENIADSLDQGITYRILGVEDFRSKSFPNNKEQADHLGAKIYTQVRLTKDSTFRFDSKLQSNQVMYSGKVENIAFEAVMLPDYSWWSPKVPPFNKPYVLQHEQIHFALTELTARRLSKSARRKMQNFVIVDATQKGAKEQLQRKITTLLKEALNIDLRKQLELDLETSLHFDPEKQQEWFEKVNAQLKETSIKK